MVLNCLENIEINSKLIKKYSKSPKIKGECAKKVAAFLQEKWNFKWSLKGA